MYVCMYEADRIQAKPMSAFFRRDFFAAPLVKFVYTYLLLGILLLFATLVMQPFYTHQNIK